MQQQVSLSVAFVIFAKKVEKSHHGGAKKIDRHVSY